MSLFRKTFLYSVYITNRPFFYFLAVFIAGQAFFTYKGINTLPFFNYGMYSEVFSKEDTLEYFSLYADGMPLDIEHMPSANEDYIRQTLNYYWKLEKNNFEDPVKQTINKRTQKLPQFCFKYIESCIANPVDSKEKYQKWLLRYLKEKSGKDIIEIKVYVRQFQSRNDSLIIIGTHELLATR